MFQILKEPNFEFMAKRKALLTLSVVAVLASIVVLAVHGLNLGIEFTGGTELQVKYVDSPNIGEIRSGLASAGMTSQTVTSIGLPEENEVYIRLASDAAAAESEDMTGQVLQVLRAQRGVTAGSEAFDINIADEASVQRLLESAPGLGADARSSLAAAILEARKEQAIFHTFDELSGIDGMTPQVLDFLRSNAVVGPLALRSQSYIGPAVGHELMNKALLAILGSLIGMLIYIWIRFQLPWGMAAVAALAHDTVITLGLFSIFNQEMSLPVVAAFLTLVGYSVNDTVVVFDRIRENLKSSSLSNLLGVINDSLNQTLSRTVITSGLTWIVVFGLFLFGGAALRPFSFVLTIGVFVGTYSSIFIASPLLVIWYRWSERRKRAAGAPAAAAPAGERKARKVRRTGAN